MIRGILQVIIVLFVLRIFFWFLRLISAGMREGDSQSRTGARRPSNGPAGEATNRRKPLRVDRSNVTDVPFTEIPDERVPAERATEPGADPDPAERAEAR